jgi:AraC-like DNA-binding protein
MSNGGIADSVSAAGGRVHWYGSAADSGAGQNRYSQAFLLEIRVPRSFTLSACQIRRRAVLERRVRPHRVRDGDVGPFLTSPAVDCHKLAENFAFFVDRAALNGAGTTATAELVWIRRDEDTQSGWVAARPALLVYAPNCVFSAECTEIVPHLGAGDPFLQHIALVLETRLQARTADGRLYAELLADALALHFLRRYRAADVGAPHVAPGLPLYKLKRVLSYIDEHLDEDLSLTKLGGIAQTSVAHFARLFKQATGSTPHHYVLACRIERAKRLLVESDVSVSEVAQRVGLADQGHLTALFRTYAATTPKAYRVSTKQ